MKPKKKSSTAGRQGKRNRHLRMNPPDPTPDEGSTEGHDNSPELIRDATGAEIRGASIYFGPGSSGDVLGCGFEGGPVISDGSDIMVAYNEFHHPRRSEMDNDAREPMFDVGPNARRNSIVDNTSIGGSGMIGRVDGQDIHIARNTSVTAEALSVILAEISREADKLHASGTLTQADRDAVAELVQARTWSAMLTHAGSVASLVGAYPALSGLLQKLVELIR